MNAHGATWTPRQRDRCPCGKRLFESEKQVRLAHRTASFRVHVYYCEIGRGYHGSNGEKAKNRGTW